MGATGNLTRLKLFPALYKLFERGVLSGKCVILGVARKSDIDDRGFRKLAHDIIKSTNIEIDDTKFLNWCNECVFYQSLGKASLEDYKKLADRIDSIERERNIPGNRVFYMALPPKAFPPSVTSLGESGLNRSSGWTRLVIEKPFGRDIVSAQKLNKLIHKYYDESQIYRIDHFLAKETVQNLLVFRFANTFFEHLWNRDHIEKVEILVSEKLGIGGRANYYEQTGALRDMVSNHLSQLLSLVAMDTPSGLDASSIRNEKVKVLQQIKPIQADNVVFGQYSSGMIDGKAVNGYKEEDGVPENSNIETYAALRLEIPNSRWNGVPFYLYTGKRMSRKLTEIRVHFHCAPGSIFQPFKNTCILEPNVLFLTLQPDEGISLRFHIKSIGEPLTLTTKDLHFNYSEVFGSPPDAYETVLLDAIAGDQTLFVHSDEVESAWQKYTPIFGMNIPLKYYPAGTDGPIEVKKLASELLQM
jgi:glucose-6-phosphate 1-dehydrogenase